MPGQLVSVEEAPARARAGVRPRGHETVSVDAALGRVLAEDVVSDLELPPFDSSAMDGFAVVAGPGGRLPVGGEAQAGQPFDAELQPGAAVRISTGAVIPRGADAVVPIERVTTSGELVEVPDTQPGANVRRAGDDIHRGARVLAAGTGLGPAELGMLAALGLAEASCAKRPRLAIVATGDELVPAGQPLGPGQIHDSNAVAIGALARGAGAQLVDRRNAGDAPAATVASLTDALARAEVLCISGGVSVGPHDHVKPALLELGFEELLWRVRLKPGKPFWFGVRNDQYAFGLPGNPVSAMVTFQLFARPALRALQGADPAVTRSTAILDGPIAANSDRDQAVRCRLRMEDAAWHVEPTGPQGSHVMSSMLGAGALAIVPADDRDLLPGERVAIELI